MVNGTNFTHYPVEQNVTVCINGLQECAPALEKCMILLFAILSVFINIIHVNLLSKMPALKNSPLLTLLKAYSLAEVIFGLSLCVRSACQNRPVMSQERYAKLFVSILGSVADNYRRYVLATFLIERNVSMVCCLKMKEPKVLKHIVLILIGEFVLILMITMVRDLIYYDQICFFPLRGATNEVTGIPKSLHKWQITLNMIVVFISLGILMFQLNRVKYKPLNETQKEVLSGSKYAALMTIGYLFACVPLFVCYRIIYGHLAELDYGKAELAHLLSQLIFGIFCCALYALVNKAYRSELSKYLNWFKAKLRNLL